MKAPIDDSSKTYKTRANAIKAFHAVYPPDGKEDFNWTVATTPGGRFFPLCIGQRALNVGAHFHFAVTN